MPCWTAQRPSCARQKPANADAAVTASATIGEFELIERYFRRAADASVALGIGDDGALLELPPDRLLVAVVDTSVAGVHFPVGMDAADVGYRSVAVNLSDIAAMGATPAWMTLALTLPGADPSWLADFARGLFEAADQYGVALVGGDTTRGAETVISIQLLGHVSRNASMPRSGCKPGDRIYVSGTLGDAAAGLSLIQSAARENFLTGRFRRPSARVELGQAVANFTAAAIDISDGLYADLERILSASGTGATVERQDLPLSEQLLEFAGDAAARQLALTGGDDYELCLTVAPESDAGFRRAAAQVGVPVTCIGKADREPGLRLTDAGRAVDFRDTGYRHFRNDSGAANV